MLLREVNKVICFDVWMMIIELDPEVFRKVRLINRKVMEYTNEHIDKYMKMFSRPFKSPFYSIPVALWSRFVEWHRPLRESYSILPNGNKHGTYFCQGHCFKIFSNYKNGALDGEYKELNSSGSLIKLCNYKNGKLEGEYKEFSSDGSLIKLCNYKNGELDGECAEYCGNYLTLTSYKNGRLDGECNQYYGDHLGAKSYYKDGWLHGKYMIYQRNGMLSSIRNYKNGVLYGPYCTYDNNGIPGEITYYKNNVVIKPNLYFKEYMGIVENKIKAVKFQHKKIYTEFKTFKPSGKYKRSRR